MVLEEFTLCPGEKTSITDKAMSQLDGKAFLFCFCFTDWVCGK